MPRKKQSSGINPELETAIGDLLAESSGLPLADRLSIIDRALKLEGLRAKVDDGVDGSNFGQTGEDE